MALKLEFACMEAAKIQDFAASVNLYRGAESVDGGFLGSETTMALPCVIFHCESADKYVPRSQARRCRLRTIVRTSRDDEQDSAHRERCATIFAWALSPGFEQGLQDRGGIGVLLSVEGDITESQSDRNLESVLEQTVDCVPFVIA